jgi:hypothetical protein
LRAGRPAGLPKIERSREIYIGVHGRTRACIFSLPTDIQIEGSWHLSTKVVEMTHSFDCPALIATLGGLRSSGLVGLFLGPVVMAALVTVWREWVGMGDRPRLG